MPRPTSPRFICPHCHSPVDPRAMDAATAPGGDYRICPVCDEAVALASGLQPAGPPPARRRGAAEVTESVQ